MLDQIKNNYKLSFVFAFDGLEQTSYSFYRAGGNFKKAFNNMEKVTQIKQKYNFKKVKIILKLILC